MIKKLINLFKRKSALEDLYERKYPEGDPKYGSYKDMKKELKMQMKEDKDLKVKDPKEYARQQGGERKLFQDIEI
jgi:hypothetical protein